MDNVNVSFQERPRVVVIESPLYSFLSVIFKSRIRHDCLKTSKSCTAVLPGIDKRGVAHLCAVELCRKRWHSFPSSDKIAPPFYLLRSSRYDELRRVIFTTETHNRASLSMSPPPPPNVGKLKLLDCCSFVYSKRKRGVCFDLLRLPQNCRGQSFTRRNDPHARWIPSHIREQSAEFQTSCANKSPALGTIRAMTFSVGTRMNAAGRAWCNGTSQHRFDVMYRCVRFSCRHGRTET